MEQYVTKFILSATQPYTLITPGSPLEELEEFYKINELKVPANSIREFFKEMDKNGDGTIDIGELMMELPM